MHFLIKSEMKIIFSWPSSAIRFFFQKNCSWPIDAIAHHAWMVPNQIRNGDWMQDQTLKDEIGMSGKTEKKSQILESKYPRYSMCRVSEL